MKSVPRWLTSMTDIPLPRQSSSSACARSSTGSGSIAGPGLKLKTRFMGAGLPTLVAFVAVVAQRFDARYPDESIVLVEPDQAYALRVAAHRRNFGDGRAYERTRRGDQHELVVGRNLQRA